jgi:hypothetical protein
MCIFIVVISIFEVMIRSSHGDVSAAVGVCDSALCPRRLPSYVVADGASFIVCLDFCLSRLVCDVYFYCGNKHF